MCRQRSSWQGKKQPRHTKNKQGTTMEDFRQKTSNFQVPKILKKLKYWAPADKWSKTPWSLLVSVILGNLLLGNISIIMILIKY